MPKKTYGWEGGEIPLIGEHSLAKHTILREYVVTYIDVLTQDPRVERLTLTLVDGFAGGAVYRRSCSPDLHFGSPVILIDAAAEALTRVNAARLKPLALNARFVFVEKVPEVVQVLDGALKEHVYPKHPNVSPLILTGDFESHLAAIIDDIRSVGRAHRAIFLLDQYGYNAVPIRLLQQIFASLPNAEVFLTLATGWISSYLHSAADAKKVLRERLGIRSEASAEDVEQSLIGKTDDARLRLRVVQQLLHDAFVRQSGAKHFTPFFILSRESNRPYWFLHLANSAKANDVVKELHWRVQNHFSHFGETGLSMLGFDPSREVEPAQLSFGFDKAARDRTLLALAGELPARIRTQWPDGVPFERLMTSLTNETPATRMMLREVATELCRDGELSKRGGNGEGRRASTAVRDNDVLQVARQMRLFMK